MALTHILSETETEELVIRLARVQQIQADLCDALADVDRQRKTLERLLRAVAALDKEINGGGWPTGMAS